MINQNFLLKLTIMKVGQNNYISLLKDIVDEMKLSIHPSIHPVIHPWMASYNNPLQCEG